MKLRGAPFQKVNIFLLFIVILYVFDPREFENRHIFLILISAFFAVNIGFQSLKIRISALFSAPRSLGGAREHFSKIQKHLISAFFAENLGFEPLRIRISAYF